MYTNAQVTLKTQGESYDDDTGNLQSSGKVVILKDRCLYSQLRNSDKKAFSDGYRQYTERTPVILIPGHSTVSIPVGTVAEVKPDMGPEQTYSVVSALFTAGVAEGHWEVELQAVA